MTLVLSPKDIRESASSNEERRAGGPHGHKGQKDPVLQLCGEKKDLEFKCWLQRKLQFALCTAFTQGTVHSLGTDSTTQRWPPAFPQALHGGLSAFLCWKNSVSSKLLELCPNSFPAAHSLGAPHQRSFQTPAPQGGPSCLPAPTRVPWPAQHTFCRREACWVSWVLGCSCPSVFAHGQPLKHHSWSPQCL